jgi:3-hydroxyacyl-[acyl-carrier-protein] dehydratase
MMNPDPAAALAKLPHGPAFRFVDEITALVPGREAAGFYHIRGDEAFLAGHFPENPMMPGVLLLEMIAQLGGMVGQTDPDISELSDLRLTAVRAAKILGAAVPGERLEIHARLEGRMGGLVQIAGEVTRGGELLASAKITLSGTP